MQFYIFLCFNIHVHKTKGGKIMTSLSQVKKEKVKQVYTLLQQNKTIILHGYCNYNGISMPHDSKLYLTRCNNIGWESFGSSAIKNNLKDLTWLINTIFKCKNKDFSFEIEK